MATARATATATATRSSVAVTTRRATAAAVVSMLARPRRASLSLWPLALSMQRRSSHHVAHAERMCQCRPLCCCCVQTRVIAHASSLVQRIVVVFASEFATRLDAQREHLLCEHVTEHSVRALGAATAVRWAAALVVARARVVLCACGVRTAARAHALYERQRERECLRSCASRRSLKYVRVCSSARSCSTRRRACSAASCASCARICLAKRSFVVCCSHRAWA